MSERDNFLCIFMSTSSSQSPDLCLPWKKYIWSLFFFFRTQVYFWTKFLLEIFFWTSYETSLVPKLQSFEMVLDPSIFSRHLSLFSPWNHKTFITKWSCLHCYCKYKHNTILDWGLVGGRGLLKSTTAADLAQVFFGQPKERAQVAGLFWCEYICK